jgi:hypothetical protein
MLRATNHAGQFQTAVTCHTDTVGGFLKSGVLSHRYAVPIVAEAMLLVLHSSALHHLGLLCFV